MGDRCHNRHGPKRGGLLCPFRGGARAAVYHNVSWAEVYFRTKWRLHPSSRLATIDMGQKVRGLLCPFPWGAGSPSNTMSPGLRPASVPSGILIHPTVWSQSINVTDSQDNGPVAQGEPLLATVGQKIAKINSFQTRAHP